MARLLRVVLPGDPHHAMQRGVCFMDVFHLEVARRRYLGMLGEEIAGHGVGILEWCLMADPVHFVAVPHRETSRARAASGRWSVSRNSEETDRQGPEQRKQWKTPKASTVKKSVMISENPNTCLRARGPVHAAAAARRSHRPLLQAKLFRQSCPSDQPVLTKSSQFRHYSLKTFSCLQCHEDKLEGAPVLSDL